MKVKTSISVSKETLRAIDHLAGKDSNRSRVIEEAVAAYVAQKQRAVRDARDLEMLNRSADALNREMAEALAFQADL